MMKAMSVSIGAGIILAAILFVLNKRGAPHDQGIWTAPELEGFADSRYAGLPTQEEGFAPHGWIRVVEQAPTWNPDGVRASYPVSPRPEWFPFTTFLGPPVPESAVGIDPRGYMFRTSQGIRIHRDGWVVTDDGRAFRAAEKITEMGFPQLTRSGDE